MDSDQSAIHSDVLVSGTTSVEDGCKDDRGHWEEIGIELADCLGKL